MGPPQGSYSIGLERGLGVWWCEPHLGFSGAHTRGPHRASCFPRMEGLQQGQRGEVTRPGPFPSGAAGIPARVGMPVGLHVERSRNVTPFLRSRISPGGPQAWDTPSSCLPCCHIQEASEVPSSRKAPRLGLPHSCSFPPASRTAQGCAHLVYGNAEFSLGVWPVKFYLSLVSPHLQQDVTETLAQSCKRPACPGLPGLSPPADPSLFSLHSPSLKWVRGGICSRQHPCPGVNGRNRSGSHRPGLRLTPVQAGCLPGQDPAFPKASVSPSGR